MAAKVPHPRKAPQQARSQATVEAILDAAARILSKDGAAGFNTNRVAETAGVSIGSLYQYFPNKDALIAALHERHGRQMVEAISRTLDAAGGEGLREAIEAVVRALVRAHLVDPKLHRVLELEFPFFDEPSAPGAVEDELAVYRRVRHLLQRHRREVAVRDLDLAAHIVMQIVHALVHAAVLDPPRRHGRAALEAAIVDAALGYLTLPRSARPARRLTAAAEFR